MAVKPPAALTAAETALVEPFSAAMSTVTRFSPLERARSSSVRSCCPSLSLRSTFLALPFSAFAVGAATEPLGSGSAADAVETLVAEGLEETQRRFN